MFGSSSPSIADIAAVTGGNGCNNGWGNGYGDGWWVLIILFALFGGWGRNGAFGGNGGCGCDSACATVGDVERGFNNQSPSSVSTASIRVCVNSATTTLPRSPVSRTQ